MKYFKGKILIIIIVMLSLFMSSINVTAAPVVDEVTTNPASPTPQSTITISAKISGNDITSVNVTISECKVGLCFIYNTYPMSKNEAGDWVAHATLQDDSGDSTYIKYQFYVIDNGLEYTLDEGWKVNLSIENNNNTPNDNNGKTPGFEIITLLAAIIIGTVLLRKKRF
jgi:hypothetical protein